MLHIRNPMRSEQREQSLGTSPRANRAAGTTHSLPDSLAAQWNGQLAISNSEQKSASFLCARAKIFVKNKIFFSRSRTEKHPEIALVPA